MTDARLSGRLALIWAGVMLVFAVVPTHEVLSTAVGERESLTTQVGHFVEFAVLAWLLAGWVRGHASSRWRAAAVVWVVAVAYGGLIEVLQAPLPYRSAQWSDLAIDAAGAVAGLVAFRIARGWAAPGARRHAR